MGVLDFLSKEAGQARRRALDERIAGVLDRVGYYAGPELSEFGRGLLQVGGMLNPVQDVGNAMAAGRDGRWGDMAVDVATVVAPVAAGKAAKAINPRLADDAAQWLQDALTGLSVNPTRAGLGDAAQRFAADESGALTVPQIRQLHDYATQGRNSKKAAKAVGVEGVDRADAVALMDEMKAKRSSRMESRLGADPLVVRGQNRARSLEARRARIAEEQAVRDATTARQTMKSAAQRARNMGLDVRSSADRSGNVSSYYIRRPDGSQVRISDHELPWSPRREFMAQEHGRGGFSGFHGEEVIVDSGTALDDILRLLSGVSGE